MKAFREWKTSHKVEMIIYALVAIILFYSCYYADFYETGLEGVSFWDILFSGRIRNFYTQIFLIGNTQYIPLYDFPMYIVFAVWNFPLWVVQKLTEIDIYHSVPCLMWMKSMVIFFAGIFILEFSSLLRTVELNEAKVREGRFLFITSGFVMTGMVVLGQYDIIGMCLMIPGIREYIKGDYKKFTILFALAAPFKYFSILVYIPLVLLKEKDILKIIIDGVAVLIPCIFFWIAVPYGRPALVEGCVFSGSSSGSNVAKPIYDDLFMQGTIGFGTLFFYVAGEIIFLLLCYFYRINNAKQKNKLIIYICFVTYAIQFTLAYSHPYWFILIVPFMAMIIAMNDEYEYINIILETVLTVAMLIAQTLFFTWCFNSGIVDLSFWSLILPRGVTDVEYSIMSLIKQFISDTRLQDYASGIMLSVYLAAMVLFLYVNYPMRTRRLSFVEKDQTGIRRIIAFRSILVLCVAAVPLLLYLYTAFLL